MASKGIIRASDHVKWEAKMYASELNALSNSFNIF